MNKFKKIIVAFVAVVSIVAVNVTGASAEWRQSGDSWWYSQGSSYATGWNQIDGQWYYFDSNGYMNTGWVYDSGNWYYLYGNGTMAQDCYIGDSYLSSSGTWTNSIPTTNSNSYSSSSSSYSTGSKYHSISNCGRMNPKNATKTTVGDAEAEGYGRCSKCW
ncbi:cell wall-binding protein [Clostridium butyricum]|uniref:cell wall-binding protein n=1 Tax=Clostridium butyricum TaxID=1492 RepID=UPI003F5BED52